jgi:ABC-type nitrate/sulfonate/bicarbonate transport system substrate-binding protein
MKLSRKRLVTLAATAVVIPTVFAAAAAGGRTTVAAGPTYTVCIDIPFHPIFDYVMAKNDTYFAGKPYNVKFKVLDATTQVPAFGAGQCDVMTTPPSFIPRVMDRYHIKVAEFYPLARWVIGPQILVKADSKLTTLASLKGKRVAIPPLVTRFGAEEAAILAATGENIRTYFKLKQTDAAAQELTLGRVDAAFIEAPTTFPLLQSKKFKAVYSVHDAFKKAFGDPAVVNGGYIARTSFIKKGVSARFVKDLVKATGDAWNRYRKDPDEVNDVASKISGVPPEQLAVVGDVLFLKKMPANLRKISRRDVRTWTKLFPLLAQSGFNKSAPANPAALFVVTK